MPNLKKRITKLAAGIEANVDELLLALRKRLKTDEPLQIVTYRSYGTVNHVYAKGRVLVDKHIRKPTDKDTVWNNLVSMYKRFESDEIPYARLKLDFQGKTAFMTTDEEGYFSLDLFTEEPIVWKDMWYEIKIELVEAPIAFSPGITTTAHVLIPPTDAEYGIISDIDDTIIKTNATSVLAMSRNTFLHNAFSRLPFAGVSEFYKSLQQGRNGKRNNPFFYVSSSPWNLYDLLIDFLDLNNIPAGPLLLRDFGLEKNKKDADHKGHKLAEIKNILLTYPHLNFVLIGDSGQEDPVIYRDVVHQFPGRVLAIYIRDVQLPDRQKIAQQIAHQLAADNIPMIVMENTVEAAEHAAKTGLIVTDAIPRIVTDKKQDTGELQGKEVIL